MDIREHLREIKQLTTLPIRYFAYNELGEDNPVIVTEDQIRQSYWPYWKGQMLHAIKENSPNRRPITEADITFENCLDEWVVLHWAWDVDQDGNPLNGVDAHGV